MKAEKNMTVQYAFLQFLHNASLCSILAFITPYLQAIETKSGTRMFSDSQIGTVLALGSFVGIIISPILASFSDKHPSIPLKSITAILLLISAVGGALLLILPNFFLPVALISVVLYSMSRTQGTFLTSLGMEHVYAGENLNYSLCRGFGSIGYAVMAFFMGYAVDWFGSGIIMILLLACCGLDALLVLFFPKVKNSGDNKSSSDSVEQEAISLLEFAKRNIRFIAVVFAVVLIYASHQFINTYTINIVRNLGGTEKEMGIGTAIAAVLELPGMALVPWLRKKLGSAGALLKLSAVAMIIKSIITLIAPSIFVFYIAQCIQFFTFAVIIPGGVFFVNETIDPANKVKGMSIFDMGLVISGILFNKIGGMLFDSSSVELTLLVGTIVTAVGTVLLFVLLAGGKFNKTRENS